jgi:anti-sigma factor RsiW
VSLRDDELMRYFDGEVDAAWARRIERELTGSEADRKRLAALGEVRALLRGSVQAGAAQAPSEAMWAAIQSELVRGRRPPLGERLAVAWSEWWEGPARYWTAATAAAAIAALVIFIARPGARAVAARDVVIESVETAGVTATVFIIPDEAGGDGTAVLWITPESEGEEQ